MMKAPTKFMITHPTLGLGEGNNGAFVFQINGVMMQALAYDGEGWEHVSVRPVDDSRSCTFVHIQSQKK